MGYIYSMTQPNGLTKPLYVFISALTIVPVAFLLVIASVGKFEPKDPLPSVAEVIRADNSGLKPSSLSKDTNHILKIARKNLRQN